jgi:hypothetical protein
MIRKENDHGQYNKGGSKNPDPEGPNVYFPIKATSSAGGPGEVLPIRGEKIRCFNWFNCVLPVLRLENNIKV